jgi:hypothetical protein
MNKEMFWVGVIMQIVNLVILSIFFIEWNFEFVMDLIICGSYLLFNLTSLAFILFGCISKE